MNQLLVQLINEDFGVLNLYESEPIGLDSFSIKRERDELGEGFLYEFSVNLEFHKEGREFVQSVFEQNGVDGVISINIYSYNANTYSFEIEYEGQLQLDNYSLTEETVKTNVEPVGFERKFLNQVKRNVSMDDVSSRLGEPIGAANSFDLTLPSRSILQQFIARPDSEIERQQFGVAQLDLPTVGIGPGQFVRQATVYASINNNDRDIDDFDSTISQDFGWSEGGPDEFHRVTTDEAGLTDINISLRARHEIIAIHSNNSINLEVQGCGVTNLLPLSIKAFFEHRKTDDTVVSKIQIGTDYNVPACPGVPGSSFTSSFETKTYMETDRLLDVGDKLYVYYQIDLAGTYEKPGATGGTDIQHTFKIQPDNSSTEISVKTRTQFPESEVRSYMVYEFLEHIVSYLTDNQGSMRSEFFGRTDSSFPYPQDGPGSSLCITNGRSIRKLETSTVFANWEDAFTSLNSIFCLGYGFENLEDGSKIIRIEQKSYFYNNQLKAVEIDTVSSLKKVVEIDMLYSDVKIGYPKIENIGQTNGVDEFNTNRTFSSPLINTTNELDIRSVYRASSFEIESQRRIAETTEESKLDDENFMIYLKRDGGNFVVETGADFEQIIGLFDSETAYNIEISPARSLRRWGYILASNLIRSADKAFKFSFGDYNYNVATKRFGEPLIFENGDYDMTDEVPLFYPELYEFEIEAKKNTRDLINDGINGYMVGNDWSGNTFEGFFKVLDFSISENKGDLTILRLYRE